MTDFSVPQTPPRKSWKRALALPVLFFVGGLGAAGWAVTQTEWGASLLSPAPAPITIDASKLAANGQVPPVTPDVNARIAELEGRLARAESSGGPVSTSAASTSASQRVNGLVLAFAARRALERGQPLGAIEADLQSYFGTSQPHLLAALSTVAKQPVTLAQLIGEFDALSPALSGRQGSMWDRVTGAMASLAALRKADQATTDPARIFATAKASLLSGNVAAALEQVSQLPARGQATDWMIKAKRYAAGQAALDSLEASAFVQPVAIPVPPILIKPPVLNSDPIEPERPASTGAF
jgi:hypothetical protein